MDIWITISVILNLKYNKQKITSTDIDFLCIIISNKLIGNHFYIIIY